MTETKTKASWNSKNVTFAYPGHAQSPVIRNVSFTASPGKPWRLSVVLEVENQPDPIDPTFLTSSEGQVLVDGVDVRDYSLTTLRNKIGFIPQKALLFRGRSQKTYAMAKKMPRKQSWNEQPRLRKRQISFLAHQMALMLTWQKAEPTSLADKSNA